MQLADLAAGLGQGAVYAGSSIVSAGVVGAAIFYNKKRKSIESKLNDTAEAVIKISDAILGKAVTGFDPHPAKGISRRLDDMQDSMDRRTALGDELISRFNVLSTSVDTVMVEHAKRMKIGDKMVSEFEVWKDAQTELTFKMDAMHEKFDTLSERITVVESGVKELVIDSKTNGGSTTKDQLNRIEENTSKESG